MSFSSSSPSVDSADGKSMPSLAQTRQARHECHNSLEIPTLDNLTFHNEQPEVRDTMRRQLKSTHSVGNGAGNQIPKQGSRHTQELPGSAPSNTVKDPDVEMTASTEERCNQRQQIQVANDKAARSKEPNNSAVSSNNNGQGNKANLDQVPKRMEDLQTQLKQAKADASKYEGRARDYKERMEQAERQCRELDEENRQLINDARSAMTQRDQIRNDADQYIQHLKLEHSKQTAELDTQVRQLLDKVTRDKGKWNPPPDDKIRDKFNRLNDDIREWSGVWASKDLKLNHMSSDFLSTFVATQASGSLPQYLYQLSQKRREKLGPLLLHAALSHEIHEEFFENPFWLVDKDQAVLTNIFDRLKASNAKEAHIWRASLWRLLNPPSHVPLSKSAANVAEETRKHTNAFCESLDRRFQEGPAANLFAPTDPVKQRQRAIKLHKIMSAAAEVATILWTQHSYLSILNLKYLHDRNIRFDVASPFLEGHPLSRVDVDDYSHNGEGIIVVTRPALLAFDEDDVAGIDGDRYRVLEKATVLLESKK